MVLIEWARVRFASREAAQRRVAGVSVAGRLLRELDRAGLSEVAVELPRGSDSLPRGCAGDVSRLAPNLQVHRSEARPRGEVLELDPAWLVEADILRAFLDSGRGELRCCGTLVASVAGRDGVYPTETALRLDGSDAGLAILRRTVKPLDGFVSRYVNRPVSRRISLFLLQFPAFRPVHATALTALAALAMFLALVSGQAWSLFVGGVLYQVASMVDGVDGEIARATFRASRRGARLDSLIDIATNLGFLLGVTLIASRTGPEWAVYCGVGTLVGLPLGLLVIGWHVARRGEPLSFDLVKRGRIDRTGVTAWQRFVSLLAMIASRDFYALAFALMAMAGFLEAILALFAIAVAVWLGAVVYLLIIRREAAV